MSHRSVSATGRGQLLSDGHLAQNTCYERNLSQYILVNCGSKKNLFFSVLLTPDGGFECRTTVSLRYPAVLAATNLRRLTTPAAFLTLLYAALYYGLLLSFEQGDHGSHLGSAAPI